MAESTGRPEPSPPCTSGSVSLPVVDGAQRVVKNTRMGRRRAIVLGLVQLAIIVHVVIWLLSREYGWFGGRTVTPIEPSESMEFAKNGVINAGLIFFVLALLSTLILGRWFCGWGCHVVMLQDFCLWLMQRFKIKPKPFRSRLLLWAPLILAIYMFIWPVFYRFVIAPFTRPDLEGWSMSLHLTTSDFWATFPGVTVAIIFLGICGFATVYVLGAKGFCTYGCPYGGFFAPIDKAAPMRVRVTDACQGCGHCTAVCTSNVRVHEEVRTWGMVTDPGCMKTMDCVTNCPSDALYIGFGKSALKRTSVQRAEPRPRKWDLSMAEEIVLAVLCLILFWSWRGLYASIPMLMAIGLATVLTWVFWTGWRLVRQPNVSLHHWRMKFHGRLRLPGYVFGLVTVILLALSVQALVIRGATWNGDRLTQQVDMPVQMALDPSRPPLDESSRETIEAALDSYRLASRISVGGIGFADDPNVQLASARLHVIKGERPEALRILQDVRGAVDASQSVDRVYLLVLAATESPPAVKQFVDEVLEAHPGWIQFRVTASDLALSRGDMERGRSLLQAGLAETPDALPLLQRESIMLLQSGQVDAGIAMMRRYVELAPRDGLAWATLGQALAINNQVTEGDAAMAEAVKVAPNSPPVLLEAIRYYRQTGRSALANELQSRLPR
ncbi:MAG: 4Fe-4S binding protein [Phycisphaerales bacterium]|nr:4Fe-4S binding protein [Phycisphaerales bacterium]